MMELTEDFLRALQLALFIIGVLAIFFIFISYSITVYASDAEKRVFVLGNILLSSPCLTDSNVKSLFSNKKLDQMVIDSSCINYPDGSVSVTLLDGSTSWIFNFGTSTLGKKARFAVNVKNMTTSEIKPAEMVVTI